MTPITLSDEQVIAVNAIDHWIDSAPPGSEFRLGGYAGTGKTTVIKTIIENLGKSSRVEVSAFTGKAVNVLQRKGISARTLHSLMYEVEMDKFIPIFHRRQRLEHNPDIIIIDEASMISKELYNDLKYFRKHLLFVGDPGQLEPVGDNPNLMATTDYVLKTIHRQAAESPILRLADEVRRGQEMKHGDWPGLVVKGKDFKCSDAVAVDQVLCARNATRKKFNTLIRRHLNLTDTLCVGEKIIVLRNNAALGLFNGMILFVDEIINDSNILWWEVNCHDEVGNKFLKLKIWKEPYLPTFNDKQFNIPKDGNKQTIFYTDYAYAITCHKSQGSEWDSVIVFDEWMPPSVWDMKRWRYTAITRAAKTLTYLL